MATQTHPPSPSFGRRKGLKKTLPSLPLSAFSPPNSGTGEIFPLPPSPSTVHPAVVVDAHVIVADADGSLASWKNETGEDLTGRIGGVVLSLPPTDAEKFVAGLVASS